MIYGWDDDDTIDGRSGLNKGRIYGGSGNDKVTTGDAVFDVYGSA